MTDILVTKTFEDAEGNLLNGTVTFTPCLAGAADEGWQVSDPIVARVVNGAMSQSLVTTDSFLQIRGQVCYRVVERVSLTGRSLYYVVLSSTLGVEVDLSTLVRYSVPPPAIVDPDDPGPSADPEVSALQSQVSTLQGLVSTLETTVASLSSTVTAVSSDVATVQDSLGGAIAGVEATAAARFATIEGDVAANDAARDAQTTEVASDLATLQASFDARVGNARLMVATSYPPAGYSAQNEDVFIDKDDLV